MFTLEIAGKPIAVTNADEEQARELFMSEDFKSDLLSLRSEDRMDAVDEALEEEDEEDDDEDEEPGIDVVFLVEIDEMDNNSALS
jgi:hypothetical protein